jgi:hypothetical protein
VRGRSCAGAGAAGCSDGVAAELSGFSFSAIY